MVNSTEPPFSKIYTCFLIAGDGAILEKVVFTATSSTDACFHAETLADTLGEDVGYDLWEDGRVDRVTWLRPVGGSESVRQPPASDADEN
jgi:hypothetical protein